MCEHCETIGLAADGGAHDFYIDRYDDEYGIFFNDSENGWEGETIYYCPWCGRKLVNDVEGKPGEITILSEPWNGPDTRENILDFAKNIVTSDRNSQYGDPEDNFKLVAKLWSEYLRGTGLGDGDGSWDLIEPHEVATMMILLKIARIATGEPKADNFVDICGYAACGGEIQARKSQ